MEDMGTPCRHPAIGAMDDTQSARPDDQYATRHNPFVYQAIFRAPTARRLLARGATTGWVYRGAAKPARTRSW
jgi:hypothetical protein